MALGKTDMKSQSIKTYETLAHGVASAETGNALVVVGEVVRWSVETDWCDDDEDWTVKKKKKKRRRKIFSHAMVTSLQIVTCEGNAATIGSQLH